MENGEPLRALSTHAPSVLILRESVLPYLRERVCEMLETAAQSLAPHYKLGVVDAWRPLSRQIRIYEWMTNAAKEAFPHRDDTQIKRTVNRFVAPPYRKAPPGHCTGAAVDVWLLDKDGNVLDVSKPYERFQAAPTFSHGLDPEAFKLRMMLFEAMTTVGFSNCRDEWWHYSFGDAGWAVRAGLHECFYDLIELEEDYSEHEAKHAASMAGRPNPFL